MAIDYKAPGVSVTEFTEATIAPLLAVPDSVCIVGPVAGTVTATKNITLAGTSTPVPAELFAAVDGTIASNGIVSIKDLDPAATDPAYVGSNGYAPGSYTFNATNRTIARKNVGDDVPNITVTTTTAGSTSATLNIVTGLTPNTTYSIVTSTNIPASSGSRTSKITFTTGSTLTPTTNYPITLSSGTGVIIGSGADATITNLKIPENARVTVTYKYTPANYWNPQVYYDTPTIEAKFGNKYTDDQTAINSPVSLAAQIAFANGASEVIIQPVYYLTTSTGVKTPPTNAQLRDDVDSTGSSWTASLNALRSVNNIGTIIPVIGQAAAYNFGSGSTVEMTDTAVLNILQAFQDHINYQQVNNGEYMIAIFGEDGTDTTNTYANQATLQSHVGTLQSGFNGSYNQNMVLVSPSKFTRTTPNGKVLPLGGQYVAAAIAGALVSRRASASLTRKNIIGFTSVTDVRTRSQMTDDSRKGLLVLEQKGDSVIQVRHAITTDISTIAKSELSVARGKNAMIASIRKTIDEQIIGKVVADNNAPLIVASAIGGVLSEMMDNNDIVSFSDLQAKILSGTPTAIDVRFSYRPAFPVNNVSIGFSVDLTSGTLNLSTNTGAING